MFILTNWHFSLEQQNTFYWKISSSCTTSNASYETSIYAIEKQNTELLFEIEANSEILLKFHNFTDIDSV